jgi:hypothetical protein
MSGEPEGLQPLPPPPPHAADRLDPAALACLTR